MDDQSLERQLVGKMVSVRPLSYNHNSNPSSGWSEGQRSDWITGLLKGIHQDPDLNFTCLIQTSPVGTEPVSLDVCRTSHVKGVLRETDADSSAPKP